MRQINLYDVKHPIYAFILLSIVALTLKGVADWGNLASALAGAAVAEVALFGKELYDKCFRRKFFDWEDILRGQIGVLAGFICAWQFM